MNTKQPLSAPFLPLTVAFASGIALTYALSLSFYWGGAVIVAAVILYLIVLGRMRNPAFLKVGERRLKWFLIVLYAGVAMLDTSLSLPGDYDFANNLYPPSVVATVREVGESHRGDRLTVDVKRLTAGESSSDIVPHNLRAVIYAPPTPCRRGDEIVFPNVLQRLADSSTPLPEDVINRYRSRGIGYIGYVTQQDIRITGHHNTLSSLASDMRDRLAIALDYSRLEPATTSFLKAVLLADRSAFDDEERSAFSAAGLSHILAVSGLHIGIIALLLGVLLYPLRGSAGRMFPSLTLLVLLWGYVVITGLPLSAVRAALMFSLLIICELLERRKSALNALCVAVFVILAVDPLALLDIGLQLSVVCVAALIAVAPLIEKRDERPGAVTKRLGGAVIGSVVAVGASWPLVGHWFGNLPLLFLPVNVAVLPLLPVYVSVAVVYILLLVCGIDLVPAAYLLDLGYQGFSAVARFCAGGVLAIDVPAIVPLLWLAGLVVVVVAISFSRRRYIAIGAVAMVAAVVVTVISTSAPAEENLLLRGGREGISLVHKSGRNVSEKFIDMSSNRRIDVAGISLCFVGAGPRDYLGEVRECDYLVLDHGCDYKAERLLDSFSPQVVVFNSGASYDRYLSESYAEECRKRGIGFIDLAAHGDLNLPLSSTPSGQ